VVEPQIQSAQSSASRQTVAFDASMVEHGMAPADASLHALMRQALEVPAAAIALIEAFAAQSRALRLIQEADSRGAASLPTELRHRVAEVTERSAAWLSEGAGVRA
jgi:DnaJ-domain-containing protein 1